MLHLRGEAARRVLRLDGDDVGHERSSLATRRAVAGYERDRRADVPAQVRVLDRLADGLPVQPALIVGAARVCVIEDRFRMPRATVVADEEAGVVPAIDPLPHAPRLCGADVELGARIEIVSKEV